MLKSLLTRQSAMQGSPTSDQPKVALETEFEAGEKILETSAPHLKQKVIGVLGAKGGVGGTTIAVNLTLALGGLKTPWTLIDANLQQPDATVILGKTPKFSLVDLLQGSAELDKSMVEACSIAIGEHSSLISPDIDGSAALKTDLTKLSQCLTTMTSFGQGIVIDLPKNLDRHLVTLLDRLDRIVLVLEANVTAVACASRWTKVFSQLGYNDEKVICVLNRAGGKIKLVENQLVNYKQFDRIFKLPNSYMQMEGCLNEASPILHKHPRDNFSQAMVLLARSIAGDK